MISTQRKLGWIEVLSLTWIVAAPLIQAFRGVDLTDTGFLLSNQYWLFHDPAAAAYWFHLWLTNVLGGLVLWAAGPVGLFASKLAAAVLFWGLVWAVFRLYGKEVAPRWIWLGTAATVVFDFAGKINIVHYNNLSVLFFAWGIVFLVEGAAARRPGLFAVAGAVLAANGLVRLPNILGLALVAVPFLVDLIARKDWQRWKLGWRFFLAFLAGAVVALLAGFAAMMAWGQWPFYLQSLAVLGSGTGDSGSHYGLLHVFGRPLKATVLALIGGAVSAAGIIAVSSLISRLSAGWRKAVMIVVVLVIGLSAAFFISDLRIVASPVIGLVYLAALASLFWRRDPQDSRLSLVLVLSALTAFTLNWGSDTGIAVSTYALPLAIPGVLLLVRGSPWRWAKTATALVVCSLAVYGAWTLATHVYRDSARGSALAQVSGIGPVLTTPERARAIEELTSTIAKYSKPGDTVLIAESLPLVHYLTQTKPYLGNPWPWVFTTREREAAFAAKEREALPVLVVVEKVSPRRTTWPRGKENFPLVRPELSAFLEKNGFTLAEETADAVFYVVKKSSQ